MARLGVEQVVEEPAGVEGALPDERLGIDGQPRLALGAQHVAAVEVLMEDDRLALVAREHLERVHGGAHQRLVERLPVRVVDALDLDCPSAPRWPSAVMNGCLSSGGCDPEPGKHAARDREGFLRIGEVEQRAAGPDALEQQRPSPALVPVEEPDGAVTVPTAQPVGLVSRLAVRINGILST